MATWVYTKTGIIVVASEKPPIGVTFDDDFICPSCRCKMYYKSASSNGHVAHFAGKHNEGCDVGFTADSDGTIKDYSFSNSSLENFFDTLIAEGVKQPTTKKTSKSSSSIPRKSSVAHLPQTIKTVRQLFNVLSSSLPDDELYSGTKVKDIYCGINTRYLYIKYISGLHLVYAEYTGYSVKSPIMFCSYPSCRNEQIKVYIHFKDLSIFESAKNLLKGHRGKHVLVFARFENNNCDIDSLTQLVPLRK